MPTIINADTATGGAIITGDTSGQLQLQSGGVTALTTTGANVAVTGNLTVTGAVTSSGGIASPLAVAGNSTAGAEIRLPEDTDNGSNYVALKAPDTLAANLTLTLPTADGTSGQFLQTNGSGQLAFVTPASGTQQFTSSGSITAGAAVSLNSDGTVSTTTGISTAQAVVATNAIAYGNALGARFANSFYDAEIDRTIFVMADTSTQIFASSYRVASNGSVTSGAGVYLGTWSDNSNVVACTIVKTGTARYAVVYRYDTSTAFIRGLTINTSTGAVTNAWTTSESVVNNSAPVDATYDATSSRLIVVVKDGNAQLRLRAYDPATGSQTALLTVAVPSSPGNGTVAIASNTAVPGEFLVLFADADSSSQMRSFVGTINSAGTTFTSGGQTASISGSGVGSSVISLTYVSSINRYISIHSNSTNSFYPVVNIINTTGSSVTANSFNFPDFRQVYRFNSGCIDVTNSEIRVVGANNGSGSSLQYARMAFTASTLGTATYSASFPSSGAYGSGSAIYTPTAYSTFLTAPARNSGTTNFDVIAFTIQSFSSNAQNFAGFATNTVTTGQTAIVAVPGGVATNRTGLTRNLEYYLNVDGTLVTTPTPFGVVLRATSTTGGEVIRPVNALRPLGNTSATSGTTMVIPLGAAGFRMVQCNYTISLASAGTASLVVALSDGQTVTLSFVGSQTTGSNQVSNTTWSGLGPGSYSTFFGSLTADRLGGGTFTGRYDSSSFSGQINPYGFASSATITSVTITTSTAITSGSLNVYGIPA